MACTLTDALLGARPQMAPGRRLRALVRGALIGAAALASIAGVPSTPGMARSNKSHAKTPELNPAASCTKMKGYLTKRIEDMKSINTTIEKEQSVPNTVAGLFDLMQGKSYVDPSKAQKLTQKRREADNLNEAMRLNGCPPVDIDSELRKPPQQKLPSAPENKQRNTDPVFSDQPAR